MLKVTKLQKTYNKGKSNEFKALSDVNFEIDDGELVAIVGTSGAGKSTLLHILACIDDYDEGEYRIDGQTTKSISEKKLAIIRNEKIGLVMQDFALIDDYSVINNVTLPLEFSKKKNKNVQQLTLGTLRTVGIKDQAEKKVTKLSGGQRQRVAIARAIVNNPSVVLADEPTGSLDSKTTEEIMELFLKLNKEGKTVIIVTHDKQIAQKCNRIIELSDGKIVSDTDLTR